MKTQTVATLDKLYMYYISYCTFRDIIHIQFIKRLVATVSLFAVHMNALSMLSRNIYVILNHYYFYHVYVSIKLLSLWYSLLTLL